MVRVVSQGSMNEWIDHMETRLLVKGVISSRQGISFSRVWGSKREGSNVLISTLECQLDICFSANILQDCLTKNWSHHCTKR